MLGEGAEYPLPELPPLLAHQVLLSPRSLCGAEASIPQTLCPELMGRGYFLSGILGLGPPPGSGELQSGVGTCIPPQAEVARFRVHRGGGQEREVPPRPHDGADHREVTTVTGVRRAPVPEASPACRQVCCECCRGPGTPSCTLFHRTWREKRAFRLLGRFYRGLSSKFSHGDLR